MKRSAISLLCAAMMVGAPLTALAASQTTSTTHKPLPPGPSAGIDRAGRFAGPIHHVPIFRQGSGTIMGATITSTTTTTTTTTTVP
jgi:hypothetical protein